jgi:predicted nucleotidyltransferase
MDQIQAVADQIAREFHPEKIILFGSYAYGTPTEDSDVDLMVVLPFEGTPARTAGSIIFRVHAGFPMDVIARTHQQVEERLSMDDYFMMDVVEKGKVLYEARRPGVPTM